MPKIKICKKDDTKFYGNSKESQFINLQLVTAESKDTGNSCQFDEDGSYMTIETYGSYMTIET